MGGKKNRGRGKVQGQELQWGSGNPVPPPRRAQDGGAHDRDEMFQPQQQLPPQVYQPPQQQYQPKASPFGDDDPFAELEGTAKGKTKNMRNNQGRGQRQPPQAQENLGYGGGPEHYRPRVQEEEKSQSYNNQYQDPRHQQPTEPVASLDDELLGFAGSGNGGGGETIVRKAKGGKKGRGPKQGMAMSIEGGFGQPGETNPDYRRQQPQQPKNYPDSRYGDAQQPSQAAYRPKKPQTGQSQHWEERIDSASYAEPKPNKGNQNRRNQGKGQKQKGGQNDHQMVPAEDAEEQPEVQPDELPKTTQEIVDEILESPDQAIKLGEILQNDQLFEGFEDNPEEKTQNTLQNLHLNAIEAQIRLQERLEAIENEEASIISDLVKKLKDELIADSVQRQATGMFGTESAEFLEAIDHFPFDEENDALVGGQLQEDEGLEQIGDKDIEDILNGVLDPFGDRTATEGQEEEIQPQNINQMKVLECDMILEGINQIRYVDFYQNEESKVSKLNKIDTNQMVNQAIQKKKLINQKAEEEERRAQILQFKRQEEQKLKMEKIEQNEEKSESQEAKIDSKQAESSDSDMDMPVIMSSSKPTQQSDQSSIQAAPSRFNHANVTRREKASVLSTHQRQSCAPQDSLLDPQEQMEESSMMTDQFDDVREEKEEKYAIVDDMPMDDFDQLLPEANRAIVYPFELDVFQKRAVYRLEEGACVFVAAHTSAGKTVVAEYAIALSFKHMTKTVYTSPIKALSNQKFRDFKQKFDDVGILTGDVSINKEATCVIMTTEVLQNQVYADNDYLQDVEWVIFDEVHYIDDPERGSVWEEVIMKLPDHISIVMLSATFANYLEFTEWVGRTKKKKVYVQCTYQRPVPLEHFMIHSEKLTSIKRGENDLDVQAAGEVLQRNKEERRKQQNEGKGGGKGGAGGGKGGGGPGQKIDHKGKAIARAQAQNQRTIANATSDGQGPNSQKSGQKKFDPFFKNLRHIKSEGLLPCVVFFFSRSQVEALANEVDEKLSFITDHERKQIKDFKKKALARLEEGDRELPQVVSLCNLLDRGIGFHHAGMIPLLKEMVEILFTDNLLSVVFATSTFAIGLNMPARCVIFTQSQKFNGEKSVILQANEYLQMAGRAGRRGKDDKGASIICIDDNFGRTPSTEEYKEMFDSQGKDLASKLKLSYKTNLNVLNSESQDIDSLITNSFFSNASEQKKITAMKNRNKLGPRIQKLQDIECHKGVPEQIRQLYDGYRRVCRLNVAISKESGLKPILLHVNRILTPKYFMKNAIVLKHMPASKQLGGRVNDKYLCLLLEKKEDHERHGKVITYEEDSNFESLWAASSAASQNMGSRRGNLKSEGVQRGYYFKYLEIGVKEVVIYYKNEVKLEKMKGQDQDSSKSLFLHSNTLPAHQLSEIINKYDQIHTQQGLDEIKPKRGKEIRRLTEQRSALLQDLWDTECAHCERLTYHATQCQKLFELEEEMRLCNDILSSESNEKEQDFLSKNQVLQEYQMIDEEQNILFKGKVAKAVQSADCILLTQLIFSGHLKDLTDPEMLALLSVLVELRPAKSHDMLESQISEKFWAACMYLEQETTKLIAAEQKCGVADQQDVAIKRLNYYFYEIVYDWANKKSFLAIKTQHPNLEEGIAIKMILEVKKLCKTVKEMSILIGDFTLGQRMDEAAALLQREIMSMQSLYFE